MLDEGYIVTTVDTNPLGILERQTYSWEGGPICYVSRGFLDNDTSPGETIWIGPYHLYVMENDFCMDGYKCIRKDWPLWWILVLWHRSTRILDIIYHRSIITLAVWGLADYKNYAVPSWRDIHVVRRLSKSK